MKHRVSRNPEDAGAELSRGRGWNNRRAAQQPTISTSTGTNTRACRQPLLQSRQGRPEIATARRAGTVEGPGRGEVPLRFAAVSSRVMDAPGRRRLSRQTGSVAYVDSRPARSLKGPEPATHPKSSPAKPTGRPARFPLRTGRPRPRIGVMLFGPGCPSTETTRVSFARPPGCRSLLQAHRWQRRASLGIPGTPRP